MDTISKLSLAENFDRYFSLVLAKTAEQKRQAYAIRYRVYCEEFQYEPAERYQDQLEYDEYDQHAQHCLIIHRASNSAAGCVRLIPTLADRTKDPLPFEKYCADSLDEDFIRHLALERDTVCEISRLAVDPAFRKRTGDSFSRLGELSAIDFSQPEHRAFSSIGVICILMATLLTELSGRTNVFAMMEPRFLPQILPQFGIFFQRAGHNMDYHGIRAAYFVSTQSALTQMPLELRELYEWVKRSLQND